jgi:chromosome segregation ATPase
MNLQTTIRRQAVPIAFALVTVACAGWVSAAYIYWTAEDQATYQRQIEEATTAHEKTTEELNQYRQANGQLSAIEAQVGAVRQNLAQLEAQQEQAQAQLGQLREKVSSAQSTLSDTTALHEQRSKEAKRFLAEAEASRLNYRRTSDQLTSIQRAIADRSSELAVVGKRLQEVREREAKSREQIEALTKEASSRTAELAAAEARLQEIRKATAEEAATLSDLRQKIEQAAKQLSALNEALAARTNDVAGLETQLQTARTQLADTQERPTSKPDADAAATGQQSDNPETTPPGSG